MTYWMGLCGITIISEGEGLAENRNNNERKRLNIFYEFRNVEGEIDI